jgi:anti-sigma B factor antagonist
VPEGLSGAGVFEFRGLLEFAGQNRSRGRQDLVDDRASRIVPPACFVIGKELLGMAKTRRIKVDESGPVSVVTFADSKIIDEAEIQELGQELYDLVERDNRKKIVLNFGNVEFLSSAALGKLIGFDKRVKQHSAELILTNIRPEIYEVFAITKLTKLFQIKDDEADALAVL